MVGTVTLTGASSLSCEDARRTLIEEDKKKMIAQGHIKRKGKSNGSGLRVAQRLKDFSVVPLVYQASMLSLNFSEFVAG